ncbi:MAG: hypothetical protein JXB03_11170 [Spirochaetales bacterium]|nr:hypothetical protein [Spirochaetales bacterium]
MEHAISLTDYNTELRIHYQQLFAYCGPSQIIATALCIRLFEQAFREMSPVRPPGRETLGFLTAFPGRGVLECVELITRIPSLYPGRFVLDIDAGPENAPAANTGRFYFEVQCEGKRRSYTLIDGFADDEFRRQVKNFQALVPGQPGYNEYMAYKQKKTAEMMACPHDMFTSAAMSPFPLKSPASPTWYGLEAYKTL